MILLRILAYTALVMVCAQPRSSDNYHIFRRKLKNPRRLTDDKGEWLSPPARSNPSIDTSSEIGASNSGQQVAPRADGNEAPLEISRRDTELLNALNAMADALENDLRNSDHPPRGSLTHAASFDIDVWNPNPPPLHSTSADSSLLNNEVWNPNPQPLHSTNADSSLPYYDVWNPNPQPLHSTSADSALLNNEVWNPNPQPLHSTSADSSLLNYDGWNPNPQPLHSTSADSALFNNEVWNPNPQPQHSTSADSSLLNYDVLNPNTPALHSTNADSALYNNEVWNPNPQPQHSTSADSSLLNYDVWNSNPPPEQSADTGFWSSSGDVSSPTVDGSFDIDWEQNADPLATLNPSSNGGTTNVDRVFYSNPYGVRDHGSTVAPLTFTIWLTPKSERPMLRIVRADDLRADLRNILLTNMFDIAEDAITVEQCRGTFYKCTIQLDNEFHTDLLRDYIGFDDFYTRLQNVMTPRDLMVEPIDVSRWAGPFMRFRQVHIGLTDPFIYRSSAPHFYHEYDVDTMVSLSHADAVALISSEEGANVRAILSFVSVDIPNAKTVYATVGIHEYKHIPVGDYEPISVKAIEEGIKYIQAQRRLGRRTLIYCGYGDGRTGTFLAAYEARMLIQDNPSLSLEQVESYVTMRNTVHMKMAGTRKIFYSTHGVETTLQADSLFHFVRDQYAKSKADLFFGIEIEDFCCC